MKDTLQLFLELPDVCHKIKEYQENILRCGVKVYCNSTPMSNIIMGKTWNTINTENKEIILPLILYFDDFESGNPLGSHAGCYKIGAVYFTIATIQKD